MEQGITTLEVKKTLNIADLRLGTETSNKITSIRASPKAVNNETKMPRIDENS